MRKSLMAIGVVASIFVTGCTEPVSPNNNVTTNSMAGAPQWVLMPKIEGAMADLGIANPSPAGMPFQREQALADGRNNLATQMETRVKKLYTGFTQVTGIGKGATVDANAKSAAEQVAKQTLSGSRQENAWVSGDGTLYVLMVIDAGTVKSATEKAVKTSLRNEEAAWQQYQAKKGDEALKAAIDAEFK